MEPFVLPAPVNGESRANFKGALVQVLVKAGRAHVANLVLVVGVTNRGRQREFEGVDGDGSLSLATGEHVVDSREVVLEPVLWRE